MSVSTYKTLNDRFFGYEDFNQYLSVKNKNNKCFLDNISNNKTYIKCYNNSIFKEMNTKIEGSYPDVSMEEYKIIDSSEGSLATIGAAVCFAVCVKGKNKAEKYFIGLYHTSHCLSLSEVLSILNDEMKKKGCLKKSNEFFILGGRIVSDDPETNSLDVMEDAISLVKKFNIKGLRFNDSLEAESSFDVLLTANKIYYSTERFFNVKGKIKI